jgi:aminobenzoyl-glutamate utilization protein B
MENQAIKKFVMDWIESNKQEFYEIADFIWENPELGLEEYKACEKLTSVLSKNGFIVTKDLAGMPTAFIATYGTKGPVVGINAEYDCLPGLSQKSECKVKTPLLEGAPGQGCGHNILGTTAVLAGIALRYALEEYKIEATIKVLGSPAEEQCIGKPFMGRAGLYNGVDFFLDWHPWNYNRADYDSCNAYFNVKYHFKGRTSHGNSPWNGRSALDAALLSAHAIEMLREHYAPSAADAANTINYTFPDVGPEFPSVVSDRTTMWVIGRFTTSEDMVEIMKRIDKCAEAGALATDTTVEKKFITASHEKIPNKTLSEIVYQNFKEIGAPRFTEAEQNLAKEMQKAAGVEPAGLDETLKEFGTSGTALCDTSEYSWSAPYATFWLTLAPSGSWHNWMVTACAKGSIAKKTMDQASKIMAASAEDIITADGAIEAAKAEWKERLSGRTYKCLVPDEIKPPLGLNKEIMERYNISPVSLKAQM